MAVGAKINWQNDEDDLKTSLHQSVEAVSMISYYIVNFIGDKLNQTQTARVQTGLEVPREALYLFYTI